MAKRSLFGSSFGVVAAVGGSAVGLGNIWRFPYMAGENGGAAFILIYVLTSFLIAVPIMLSEFTIGRSTQRNSKRAFQRLAPRTKWKWFGYLGILTAFVILSFYSVIGGWALEFLKEAITNNFTGKTPVQISENFSSFIASGWRPVVWLFLFLAFAAIIMSSGVEKGIERYNKILMPLFIVLLIGLAIHSFTLEGAREGISFLLNPDLSKVTAYTVLQAMGQAFFSLSLGMGCMVTYGSYIRKDENMFKIAGMVSITDVSVAILSGLVIFPAVFSFGISPTSGPDLVFLTLPNVFAKMGSYVAAVVFFFLLVVAAITSCISLLEVVIAYLSEEVRLSRKKATAYTIAATFLFASVNALSQMPESPLTVAGKNLFNACDGLSSNILMPLGGFLIVIFTGWVFPPRRFRDELTNSMRYGVRIFPAVRFLIRFVIPVVIFLLFLDQIGFI